MMVGKLSADDLESAASSAALLFYNCISQNGTDFATPSAKQAIIMILCGVCRRQRDMIQTMRGKTTAGTMPGR
jgi:hypothetical protein